jgi:O-antigen/teichoic acid export membrane protein
MSTINNIARNTSLLVVTNIISLVIGFVQNVYLARYLGADSFGIINAALNLAMIFTYVTDLGIGTYMVMQLARNPEELKQLLGNAIMLKIALVSAAYIVLVATAYLLNFTGTKLLLVLIIGVYVMLTVIIQLLQSVFQVYQTMEHVAFCQLLHPIILTAGLVYMLATGSSVVVFAVTYVISGTIILAYTVAVVVRQHSIPYLTVNRGTWKFLLLGGIPFCLNAILYYLYFNVDIQLINSMLGDAAVGYYSAAFKFIQAMMCVPMLYMMVTFPLVSQYFHKNSPYLRLLTDKSIKYLTMFGMPVCIGMFLLSDKFIYLLYQDKYMASIGVLQALSIGLLGVFIGSFAGTILMATNRQRISVVISVIAAIFNIGMNLVIIPYYGILGSAYVMAATQMLIMIMNYYFFIRCGNRLPDLGGIFKITFCAFTMGVFVYFAHGYNLVFTVITAAMIYFVLIIISRSLSNDDLVMLTGLLFNKRKSPEDPGSATDNPT